MLHKALVTVKNIFVGVIIFSLTAFFPAVSFAESASDAETCTPPSSSQPGVHVPTGADAGMFTYDCSLGVWVSDHYTYDPASDTQSPRDAQVYTYNSSTGLWDVDIWTFVASRGAYLLRTSSVNQPPAGANTIGSPAPVNSSTVVSSDAPGDASATSSSNTLSGSVGDTTSQTLNNTIGSQASTGNALVFGNTAAGNALSGNALALANVVNMLQSSGNAFGIGGNAVTFVSNINGDVNGDLLLDPALISTIQPASTDITLNSANSTDQAINNTIRLAADSGDATVDSNTSAGDATTGTATAVANVLNFLNSAVTSGQSFLGVVNINGNLNGDILMPPGFIDQLLASNVPTVTIDADIDLTNSTNQAISNNVTASSASGTATVSKNTEAGNATTGSASTRITAFNLTGSNVVGSNDLLVFVNVLGTWYGMIFNAPGATTAQLGGGITGNTAVGADISRVNATNQAITNNIDVSAHSGNASVTKNTSAGNATSGDAKAAVNLLNVANSNFSLANWFGILFINVFGTWNGSFGFNTAAGDPVISPTVATTASSGGDTGSTSETSGQPQMFTFVARKVGTQHFAASTGPTNGTASPNSSASNTAHGAVLASETHLTPAENTAVLPTTQTQHANYWLPAAGIVLGVSMLVFERVRNYRRAMM